MMYSFLGTFIAIIASSLMFYFAGYLNLTPSFTAQESFAFGSLISSTDPVAVLAIFKEMDADITLYSIIFGESIFNDAIAIVMYRAVQGTSAAEDGNYGSEIMSSIGEFFVVFMGSVLIGAFAALVIAFILKR
jgi:NhaP-type Na+/H+ or K+/H+ antiporter